MKVFILTDLEGVCGVKGESDGIGNRILNEEAAHRRLTDEVNAVAEGLLAAGATEILCWDGHGGSNSVNIEELHAEVSLYQSGGELGPAMPIDSSWGAVVQVGAHAMAGVGDGFLNHTFNSHAVVNMWLNGEAIGEIGICSLLGSYFGAPTIMVTGDEAACREAREFLGQVETVAVKRGLTRYATVNRNPAKVREELRAGAERALRRLDDFDVVRKESPYELKVMLMCPNLADACEKRGARRVDHVTVAYAGDDFMDVWSQRNGWAAGVHNRRFGLG